MKKIIFLFFSVLFFAFSPSVYTQTSNQNQCLTVGFWVENATYIFFDPLKNPESRNTFEQWADKQMASWNKILADSGVKDCFRVSKIKRVRDGQLPLGPNKYFPTNVPDINDRTVDIQWGFPKSWLDRQIKESPQIFYGTDWGLLHELSHARYLIDEYLFNINTSRDQIEVADPAGKPVVGNYLKPIAWDVIYFNKSQDLMGGDLSKNRFYAPHSAQALNHIAGQHNAVQYGNFNPPRNLGIFLDDLPKENILKIVDNKGNPLNAANIKIFQSVLLKNVGYGAKRIDNIADIADTTDANGLVSVGSNPFGVNRLSYYSNKKISPFLTNGIFILEISFNNQLEYKIIEVSDFNLAYWSGATERAVYEIKTNFIASDSPCPNGIVGEKEYKCSFGVLDNHCPVGFTEETSLVCSAVGNTPAYCCSQPVVAITPTPTPTVTATSPNSSIAVPTSDFSRGNVDFQVKFIDENGNDLVLNDQKVILKNLSTGKTLVSEGPMSDWGYWLFGGLPLSTSYEITAQPIPGYDISYSTCINCNVHPNYTNQNSVRVDVSSAANFVEVYFRFTKTPYFTPTSISSNPITSTPTTVAQIPTINQSSSIKGIIGITIYGAAVDINDPLSVIRLQGREGEANRFIIPVIVIYSNGSHKSIDLVFNYSPLQSLTPTSSPLAPTDIQNLPNPTLVPIQTLPTTSFSTKYLCTINFYRSSAGCDGGLTSSKDYCTSTDDSRSVCDDTLTTISCVTSSSCGN